MKALLLHKPGSYKKMEYGQLELPRLIKGFVRVKVEAAGLNPVDYKIADRGHDAFTYPVVLGFDIAGVVESVPENMLESERGWRVGDRVYFHTGVGHTGGFAEFVLADARSISCLPDGLSFIEAAAIPCAGFTAYQALVKRMRIRAGRSILILGGAGGLGTFAVQIAASLGLNVIATCSPENMEFLQSLGARHLIDYRAEDINKRVEQITSGEKVDYILDSVSSASALAAMQSLAYGGAIACVAGLPDLSKLADPSRPFSLHNIMLGSHFLSERAEARDELKAVGDELGVMVANGVVRPVIDSVIGFEEIISGLERIAGRHVRGKIVASIGELAEREREAGIGAGQGKSLL